MESDHECDDKTEADKTVTKEEGIAVRNDSVWEIKAKQTCKDFTEYSRLILLLIFTNQNSYVKNVWNTY